jgi:hypothetical protein
MRGNRAFFADLHARDFDGAFGGYPASDPPRLSLDPSLGKESKSNEVKNCRVRSFQGEVAAIDDNDGKGGFEGRREQAPSSLPGSEKGARPFRRARFPGSTPVRYCSRNAKGRLI